MRYPRSGGGPDAPSIRCETISADNIDAALALLHGVVPPRPSLRARLLAAGHDGVVIIEDGRVVAAIAATTDGDPPITWARIATARPRDSRRWLAAAPWASSPLCRSPHPIECTIADWDDGTAEQLIELGLRRAGRTFYMTSRERHARPVAEVVPPSAAVTRACFEIDRAAERRNLERRSSQAEVPDEVSEDEAEAFANFERMAARFIQRGDFFALRADGAVAGYLLLDENTIDSVVVAPAMQRRGLGSLLVRYACATLAARGHDLVSLLTADSNIEAVRLYERHGFRLHCVNRWFTRPRVGADCELVRPDS